VLLRSALVLVTWPQLLVGGGGIAFVLVGIASAVVLVPHIDWRREPPAATAYVCLLFVSPAVAGSCFLIAAVLRLHVWELAGSLALVGSLAARLVLARWLRRRFPDAG
jgi:hypothetical protein